MVFSFKSESESVQMRTCTVTFLLTFCYITWASKNFMDFFLIVSLRFLYGRVFIVVRRSGSRRLFSSRSCLTKLVHVVLAISPFCTIAEQLDFENKSDTSHKSSQRNDPGYFGFSRLTRAFRVHAVLHLSKLMLV